MTTVVTGMKIKQLQLSEAKTALSAAVDDSVRGRACVISRHGKPEASCSATSNGSGFRACRPFGRLSMAWPEMKSDLPKRHRGALRNTNL